MGCLVWCADRGGIGGGRLSQLLLPARGLGCPLSRREKEKMRPEVQGSASEQSKTLQGPLPENQGKHLAVTVLHVPYRLDGGRVEGNRGGVGGGRLSGRSVGTHDILTEGLRGAFAPQNGLCGSGCEPRRRWWRQTQPAPSCVLESGV